MVVGSSTMPARYRHWYTQASAERHLEQRKGEGVVDGRGGGGAVLRPLHGLVHEVEAVRPGRLRLEGARALDEDVEELLEVLDVGGDRGVARRVDGLDVGADPESRLTSFPSFCAPLSEVAALFDSNLSRRSFLGQVVDSDLQRCTGFDSEHADLFLCHIFTQRPTTYRKIERSDGRGFGRQQLLADSIEIFISQEREKRDLSRPEIYKAFKPY